jgi:tryptophan-rich sensory protein
MKQWLQIGSYIVAPLLVYDAMVIGSFFTQRGMAWYRTLHLPAITPPGWMFGVAWTVIYTCLAISFIIVLNKYDSVVKWIYYVSIFGFVVNLVMNVAWSYFFFGNQLLLMGFVWAIALEIQTILLMFIVSYQSTLAALLFLPYVIWGGFAVVLSGLIWAIN